MAEGEEQQQNIEARIESALLSRLQYFNENANTVTMVSVRRLIEEDMGLEKNALDDHKRFIKQFIEKHLKSDDQGSKDSVGDPGEKTNLTIGEVTESPEKNEKNKDPMGHGPKDERKIEDDSAVTGIHWSKVESVDAQGIEISENTIKKAIWERADHIRANSATLTLAGARQLIEEDLGLNKGAVDSFKKFIRKQVEQVLDSSIASKSAIRKETSGNHLSKAIKKSFSEHKSGFRDKQNNLTKDKEGTREKSTKKGAAVKSDRLKKHGRPENETDISSKKPRKIAKKQLEEKSNSDDGGVSEDGGSQSSSEKPVKKKVASTPVYGKDVEHLKSVIRACGMSVPPSVYKKAKQVPDSKRESFLSKELEDILSKEGLSKNPSEREIKEVKKRKERAKELEGIDISNIVTSSRRRSSSTSFMAPSRPKRLDEDGDNAKGISKDNDVGNNDKDGGDSGVNDDDDDDNEEGEEEEEEEEGEEDDSQNEEFNEDDDQDSD